MVAQCGFAPTAEVAVAERDGRNGTRGVGRACAVGVEGELAAADQRATLSETASVMAMTQCWGVEVLSLCIMRQTLLTRTVTLRRFPVEHHERVSSDGESIAKEVRKVAEYLEGEQRRSVTPAAPTQASGPLGGRTRRRRVRTATLAGAFLVRRGRCRRAVRIMAAATLAGGAQRASRPPPPPPSRDVPTNVADRGGGARTVQRAADGSQ